MSRELHLNTCDLNQILTKEILEALKLIAGSLKSSPLMDVPELCDYIKSSKPHVRKLIFEKYILSFHKILIK